MAKQQEQTPAMPAEQAAELAALEAAAGDGLQQPGQEADTPAPAVDLATELRALVQMFVGMVAPVFPSLPAIYTPEATEAAAVAVAGVCNKHGWLQGGVMGDYAEEIAAAAILAPIGLATYQGVRADIAAMKKTQQRPDTGPAPAIGAAEVGEGGAVNQKTVVFGAPIPAEPKGGE